MEENNTKKFLNNLVYEIRNIINDEKMINKCDMCQGITGRYLQSINIPFYPCSTNKVITDNVIGHSFIVALINNDYYLIDPAFIQFKYYTNEEKVINGIKCISKSPYYYMKNINEKVTNELLTNGFIKLDNASAYAYGNAFYFTKTNIPSDMKLIPISGEIYINSFKHGSDDLKDYGIGDIQLEKNNFKR